MRGVNGTLYKVNENEYYYAQLNSLQGIGVLPDGTIIIGKDRDKKINDYYTKLLLLRSEYSILKRSHLTDSGFSYEYNKIYEEIINLIKERYPNMSESEVADKYVNGWRDIPDDYYIITDVTDKINNIIESYLTDPEWKQIRKSNYINKLNKFTNEVKNGSPIDIKNQPEWYHPLYIYNNEILDLDALGNILYGVLGAYLNLSFPELYVGASAAQTIDNKRPALDDPRDVERWQQGMDLYYEWLKGDD